MIRHRTNNSPSENVSLVNQVDYGPNIASFGYLITPIDMVQTFSSTLHKESMTDENQGLGSYNNCSHLKQHTAYGVSDNRVRVLSKPYGQSEYKLVLSGVCNVKQNPYNSSVPQFRSSIGALQTNVDMSKWDVPNYSSLAVQTMWPEVESRLSLVNSIYELKDFRKLPQLIKQTSSMLSRFDDLAFMAKSVMGTSFRKKTLSEVTSVLAGHYLNFKFNLNPLMSDIQAVRTAISRTRSEVKALLDHENQVLVSHFRKTLTPDDIGLTVYPEAEQAVEDGSYVYGCKRCLTASDITYTATMEYSYTYPDWIRKHAYALGHLDALGAQLNPAIIWNGIRLSFLIDWVAKVGKFLDQFKIANFRASVSIHRFCHSIKYKTHATHNIYAFQTFVDYTPSENETKFIFERCEGQTLHQQDTSVYVRRVCVPDVINALQLSGISKTEITIGTALLSSYFSRRR